MTLDQATDAFTVAFKKTTATTLNISMGNVGGVTYENTENRRQLLAGEIHIYIYTFIYLYIYMYMHIYKYFCIRM
jgi:hypothetical protein